jgi:pimeloyl-ACP methyl ester carboxylesterase
MKCELIEFLTPKKIQLFGVYLGQKKVKTVYIFIHGLGSSIFRKTELFRYLKDQDSGVLAFNNRGSDIITRFSKKLKNKDESKIIGSAHELFTDCLDDLKGAVNWVKDKGAQNIILVGHSTGCQKSIFFLSKYIDKDIKGVVLLAPISDYSSILNMADKKYFAKAKKIAEKMVERGQSNHLLPRDIWPYYIDAQRFLSLYSGNSFEEIFPYSQNKSSINLKKTKQPVYVLIGDKDECLDRSASNIIDWFKEERIDRKKDKFEVIEGAGHSFNGLERLVIRKIKNWVKSVI